MARNPQIIVEYIANTAKLAAASGQVNSQVGKTAGRSAKAGAAIKVGFAVAATAAVAFGKSAVGAAIESQKQTAKLENVFRSMGDTTGEAAKAAEDFAGALSRKIGVDDEAIMSAQTLLATFKDVSSETGRQAGIFDRATTAAADLAAAGFGTMDGNAKQLGKALQDPTKGLTALTRAGVTFTDKQKAHIKALVDSGKKTEAQKEILKAIEGQVGGTAEATATGGEKMAVAMGEFQESVGKLLLPVIEKLTPLVGRLADFLADNAKPVTILAGVVGALAIALAIMNVALAITATLSAIIASPILLIVLAVLALIAIGILLWKKWDVVKEKMGAVMDAIKGAAKRAIDWLKDNWDVVLTILTGPFGLAVLLIRRNWGKIKDAFTAALGWARTILGKIKDLFLLPADGARIMVDKVKSLLNGMLDFLRGIRDRVASAAGRVADAIRAPINALIGGLNALQIPAFSVNINLPRPVPDVHFSSPPIDLFPHIPELAAGGIVTRPTLALLGEAGPEAVLPLGRGAGAALVNIEQFTVREEMDVARIAARLSTAVAVRT